MNLQTLKNKRSIIKRNITRFNSYLTAFNIETSSINELETRLSNVYDVLNQFENIQELIETSSEVAEIQEVERQSFEDSYYKVISLAKDILKYKTQLPIQEIGQVDGNVSQ